MEGASLPPYESTLRWVQVRGGASGRVQSNRLLLEQVRAPEEEDTGASSAQLFQFSFVARRPGAPEGEDYTFIPCLNVWNGLLIPIESESESEMRDIAVCRVFAHPLSVRLFHVLVSRLLGDMADCAHVARTTFTSIVNAEGHLILTQEPPAADVYIHIPYHVDPRKLISHKLRYVMNKHDHTVFVVGVFRSIAPGDSTKVQIYLRAPFGTMRVVHVKTVTAGAGQYLFAPFDVDAGDADYAASPFAGPTSLYDAIMTIATTLRWIRLPKETAVAKKPMDHMYARL